MTTMTALLRSRVRDVQIVPVHRTGRLSAPG